MRKINDWEKLDSENEVVEFESIKPGAYICKILQVQDEINKEYLKIKFDVVDGEFKDFFTNRFQLDNWSNQGTTYRSYKDTATKFFRAFITAIEKSNAKNNYRWDWNEQSLVGKYFVAVFGEEEYLDKNNEIQISVKVQDIRSIPALREGKIELPKLKKLKIKSVESTTTNNNYDISDDDLPF